MKILFDPRRAAPGLTTVAVPSVLIDWAKCGTPLDIVSRNSARFKGRFIPVDEELPTNPDPVALVGYGASLKDTWQELRDYKYIFTCSGAHRFLLMRDIVPTYHAESDPQVHKVQMLGDVHPSVIYLPASICHPSYMDRLEDTGSAVQLWHPFLQDKDMYRQIPTGDHIIPGGTIIGPRMMRLARLLGFTNLHMYGIDGSGGHADEHPNKKLYKRSRTVHYNGRDFVINEHLFLHISVMFDEMNVFPVGTKFTFHGDGLIQEMALKYKRVEHPVYHPLAVVKDD